MNDVMKNIKRLRQERDLTQEELAEKLHVTRQAVSNWETGKNQPDIELLKTLAETFEVDVTELLYAPKPDVEKRKRIIVAAVLCVLAVIAWTGYVPYSEWAIAWKSSHYDLRPTALSIWVLKPLAFLLTGTAAAALGRIWVNIQPKTKTRRGMVAIGAAVCLVYFAFVLWYCFGYRIGLPMPKWLLFFLGNYWLTRGQWILLIPGTLFFLACGRKAG